MFTIEEIMRIVPHRYPFLLIDRVLEYERYKTVTVLKNITINEAQFQGHFPNKPIFPGVYIIENQAQASCFLLAKSVENEKTDPDIVYYLGKVSKIAFRHPVVPGDQLITTITAGKILGNKAVVSSISRVNDKLIAKGELMFSAV